MLFIGLIGLIVISLVNVLLIRSDGLFLLINLALLPLFLALTVWETKKMKELAQEAAMAGDAQSATQVRRHGQHRPLPERPEHIPHPPEPAGIRVGRLIRKSNARCTAEEMT